MEEGEDELFEEVAGLVEEAEVCTEPLGNWEATGNGGEEESISYLEQRAEK